MTLGINNLRRLRLLWGSLVFPFLLVTAITVTTSSCSTVVSKLDSEVSLASVCPLPELVTEIDPIVTRNVEGRVFNDFDRSPDTGNDYALPGVPLILYQGSFHSPVTAYLTKTDKHGRFDFGKLPDGTYRLRTCVSGYDALELETSLDRAAALTTIDLQIKPS